jgi:hypothetical protein
MGLGKPRRSPFDCSSSTVFAESANYFGIFGDHSIISFSVSACNLSRGRLAARDDGEDHYIQGERYGDVRFDKAGGRHPDEGGEEPSQGGGRHHPHCLVSHQKL